jgi:hypothetical protein
MGGVRQFQLYIASLQRALEAVETQRDNLRDEHARLVRARDAAIAHLIHNDVKGALVALTLQRDAPEMFDKATSIPSLGLAPD